MINVSDVIEKCLPYIGLEKEEFYSRTGGKLTPVAEQFLNCVNIVYGAMFTTLSKIVHIEELTVVDNIVNYSTLAHRLNKIIKLVDKNGKSIDYVTTNQGICVEAESIVLTYSYYPSLLTINSQLILDGNINEFAFIYLVMSEYSLLCNDEARASVFYDKYCSVKECIGMTRARNVRATRWL